MGLPHFENKKDMHVSIRVSACWLSHFGKKLQQLIWNRVSSTFEKLVGIIHVVAILWLEIEK
jgi:hypothetical protein